MRAPRSWVVVAAVVVSLVAGLLVACGGGQLEAGPDHPASPQAREQAASPPSRVLEAGAGLDVVAPLAPAPASGDDPHHHHHGAAPAPSPAP